MPTGNLTTPAKRVYLGYDIAADAGVIQSDNYGSGGKNLALNPSGGNVGIGTAAPAYPFTLYGSVAGNVISSIINTSTGATAAALLALGTNTSAFTGTLFANGPGATGYGGANSLNMYTFVSGSISFGVNGSEAMRINTSGNIGIGTSNPTHRLEVVTSSTSPAYFSNAGNGLIYINRDSSADYLQLSFATAGADDWHIGTPPAGDSFNFWNTSGGNSLVINKNSNATLAGTLTQNSDERLKSDIRPIHDALPKLLSVKRGHLSLERSNARPGGANGCRCSGRAEGVPSACPGGFKRHAERELFRLRRALD